MHPVAASAASTDVGNAANALPNDRAEESRMYADHFPPPSLPDEG